jgi:DNA modification methylase
VTATWYADDSVTLYQGDALDVLRTLPTGSVNCCVTSPPYYGLRDYGTPGQYGAEDTPAGYVATMVAVFGEVARVLTGDGTLWLNLGDSYSGSWGNQGRKTGRGTQRPINGPMAQPVGDGRYGDPRASRTGVIRDGAPAAKNLFGMPWRVAFALQDTGWVLRNAIVWAKPNGMPHPVKDRLATTYEHVFLLTRSARYWFNLDAIREAPQAQSLARAGRRRITVDRSPRGVGSPQTMDPTNSCDPAGRNPGDVWTIPTQPFTAAHFATMPPALAERCILAGCRPGGTVLDPFTGSGTTGLAATRHGRRFVGVDLSQEYLRLALDTRLAQSALIPVEAS